MPLGFPGATPSWLPIRELVVVAVVLLSSVGAARIAVGAGGGPARMRRRLLFGLPVGTLLTAAGVVLTYLFLQGGLAHPYEPLVLPFRAWSYASPLGIAASSFTHNGLGHLVGNVLATLAFGTVAEYAWGHFPRRRGASTFGDLASNPYARTLAVPAAALATGLLLAAFSLGPAIGFSGVVFAMAGVALVFRPVLGALAVLASGVLRRVFWAVLNPQSTYRPVSRVVAPWWADVAIQIHAIGLLGGLLLGAAIARARGDGPSPGRFWFALLAFAFAEGLWAAYLPADGGSFVLFRWLGVTLVFATATAAAYGLANGFDWRRTLSLADRRAAAAALVVLALGTFALTGAIYNAGVPGQQGPPGDSLDVREYRVGYAEDVPDGYVGSVSVPLVGGPPEVTTSGVIVTNARRSIWRVVVPAARLGNAGEARVLVGGVGWRRTVRVSRPTWSVAGNGSVYRVLVWGPADGSVTAFRSAPARAEPVVAGRSVALSPATDGFAVTVLRDGERAGPVPLPDGEESVSVGGLTLERDGRRLVAVSGRTRVVVARQVH